ncbi:hypothetical protein FACS189454_03970 [Planctomycetales bacterium]|nr:hypothetical protein FACS189454_03970 [Planctomycetales bacterium]
MNSYPQNGLVDIDAITEDDFTQGLDYPVHKSASLPNNNYLWVRCVLLVISVIIVVLMFIVAHRKKQ